MTVFKALKAMVIAYAILGIIIWIVCFNSTNYNDIHINKEIIGVDGPVSYVWDKHDNKWDYYINYTLPFGFLTLPIYMGVSSLVSEGKINFWLYDIISLYLLFVPAILLMIGNVLKNNISNMFTILFRERVS